MRLAVLSDTHANSEKAAKVFERLRPHLAGVDGILHAGDVTCAELLEMLEAVAPLYAVAGNMDGDDLREGLGEQRLLELGGRRLGLIHGWGSPGDLPRRVAGRFAAPAGQPQVEAIVFGHSHQPLVETVGGVLLVNPGSPTDRYFAPYRSMAFLELGAEIKAEIVRL